MPFKGKLDQRIELTITFWASAKNYQYTSSKLTTFIFHIHDTLLNNKPYVVQYPIKSWGRSCMPKADTRQHFQLLGLETRLVSGVYVKCTQTTTHFHFLVVTLIQWYSKSRTPLPCLHSIFNNLKAGVLCGTQLSLIHSYML